MAEVTGDLGGQPIQLNNAATEATLREILTAILKQGVTGKGGKAQKELEKKLQELAKATEELTDEQKAALKQQKELEKQKEEEIKQAKELGEAYRGLLGAATSVITGMTNLISTLSRLDNSMTSAAQSLSAIPIVGGTLATVFGAVAGAADRTYKAFQQAATVGANFGGSITEMVNAAGAAGLTFDQFSGIVSRTGESLALLGGSTEQGARRLAELGKGIKNSQLGDELARMGYSTEQINESMVKYSANLAKTGALQGMSNQQLIAQTGQYLQNLDAVSKLTGQTKKDLEDQRNQRMKDAQFRYITSKMDAKSQEELNKFLDTLPPELQEGAKEIIATGTATSDAGKAFMTYMSGSSARLQGVNQQILKTGKFTADNARELSSTVQGESKRVAKSDLAGNMMQFGDKYNAGVMVGISNMAAREKDLGQIEEERNAAAAERAKKEKELGSKVDPATLKSFQEKIAQISNAFTNLLMNSGLLDSFMTIFGGMIKFVETFVAPTFAFLANNAGLVAAVLAPLVGLIALSSAAMAANTLATNLETLAKNGGILATFKLAAASLMSALGLGTVAKAALAAALPFWPLIAIATGLGIIFKLMSDAGWSFSTAIEALKDNLYRVLVLGFKELIHKIRSFLPQKLGGYSKEQEKAAEEKLEAERKELDDREKARDAKRAQIKKERELGDESNKNKKEQNDKEKQAAEASKPANTYDLSSPQKMFESAMRRQQGAAAQPGATAAQPGGPASSAPAMPGLGGMAAKFESGKAGSAAVGWDSTGGTSFGKYQIATKTGTMDKFMDHLKKTNPEAYERLSKAGPADSGKDGAFAQEWKKLAGEGKLAESEHDFIKKTHYDVGVGKVKDKGLQDMIGQSKALQEVMWSTSVQHGGGGAGGIFNKVYKEGMTEQDLIKAIYAERSTKFGSSTGAVQQSVQNRFAQEQQLALGLVGQPGSATPSATAAQTAVAQAPVVTTPSKPPTTQTAQAPAPTQESPTALLASLNTKLDTLISLNKKANDTRERQLNVAKTSTTDVSAWVSA